MSSVAERPPTERADRSDADAGSSGLAGFPLASSWLRARFSRITTSGRFLPEMDGLRFVALVGVFAYHLQEIILARADRPLATDGSEWLIHAIWHGDRGPHLFFVISGFILALPFASHYMHGAAAVSLKAYFLRRVTRLEPPYVLCMLVFFALHVEYLGRSASELLPHLAASLAYLHNLIYGHQSYINGVAWSLEVEVQFYLLVPLLAWVFAVRNTLVRRSIIIGLAAAAIAFQWFVIEPDDRRLSLTILNFVQFFLVGFLLADVYLCEWRSAPPRSRWWDLVSIVGWPSLLLILDSRVGDRIVFPAVVFLLYCAALRGLWSGRVLGSPWLTMVGGMCYTIYLLHTQVMGRLHEYTQHVRITDSYAGELAWRFLIIAPPVLAVSAVYFALIEKPCMRKDWPQQLAARVRRWTGMLRAPA